VGESNKPKLGEENEESFSKGISSELTSVGMAELTTGLGSELWITHSLG